MALGGQVVMGEKRYLLFDLDGTLTDPKEGITKAARFALEHLGVHVENLDDLTPMIGPPLRESFKEMHGLDGGEITKAIEKCHEYFSRTGIFENRLFDGVVELLSEQKELGKTIVLATSTPTEFAVRILKRFDIFDYFSFIAGSESDGARVTKEEIIKYALTISGAPAENAIMVGDRSYDVIGARKNGVDFIGALFGYGGLEELKAAGAERFVESVEELSAALKSL
jgi:phosphoglycolate phosphatase